MKLQIFLLSVLVFSFAINAQETRAIYPFQYQSNWGIIDSSGVEIVEPTYSNVNISKDFKIAEFDGKHVYQLETSKKHNAFGEFSSEIQIEGSTYYLFNNSESSILIDYESKDTIQLKSKYRSLRNITLYNTNKIDSTKLVLGHLKNDKIILLSADKNLDLLIKRKVGSDDFDFIEIIGNQEFIGLIQWQNGTLYCYDYQLKPIHESKQESDYLYDLDDSIIKENYGNPKATVNCYFCASPWLNDWDLRMPTPGQERMGYQLSYENIWNAEDESFNLPVTLELFDYITDVKGVRIPSKDAYFFHDSRYMELDPLMFPIKYFKQ